jgi:copper chaperone
MNFNVPEMSCGHCTAAIEKAIKEADGSASVECNLEGRSIIVSGNLQADKVISVLKDAGYEAKAA